MAVSYKKLFKILIDRDMKKKEFRDFVGISYSTMKRVRTQLLKCWKKYASNSDAELKILWKYSQTPLFQKAQSNFQKKGIHKIEVGFKAVPFLNIISISYPLLLSGM